MPVTCQTTDHRQVCTQIVQAVADLEGTDPCELTPLYEFIDPDALEALFAPTIEHERRGQVEFSYHGYHITIAVDTHHTITVNASAQADSKHRIVESID